METPTTSASRPPAIGRTIPISISSHLPASTTVFLTPFAPMGTTKLQIRIADTAPAAPNIQVRYPHLRSERKHTYYPSTTTNKSFLHLVNEKDKQNNNNRTPPAAQKYINRIRVRALLIPRLAQPPSYTKALETSTANVPKYPKRLDQPFWRPTRTVTSGTATSVG